jgi:hypothetical protein
VVIRVADDEKREALRCSESPETGFGRNVSLSGQYLEELSRRYKKQVEMLQAFSRTLAAVEEISLEREERMQKYAEEMAALRKEIMMQYVVLIIIKVIVFGVLLYLCITQQTDSETGTIPKIENQRRRQKRKCTLQKSSSSANISPRIGRRTSEYLPSLLDCGVRVQVLRHEVQAHQNLE